MATSTKTISPSATPFGDRKPRYTASGFLNVTFRLPTGYDEDGVAIDFVDVPMEGSLHPVEGRMNHDIIEQILLDDDDGSKTRALFSTAKTTYRKNKPSVKAVMPKF